MDGDLEWVPSSVLDTEVEEEVLWRWADGRLDRLPTVALDGDLPAEEIAHLGTWTEGLGVGGMVSRLHRLSDDVFLVSTGPLEERSRFDACRSSDPSSVLAEWLREASDELGYFADLPAFVAARLAGLLTAAGAVDAAVVADLAPAAELVRRGGADPELEQWTGVMLFLSLPPAIALTAGTTARLIDRAPWVRRALDGDDVTRGVLQARLDAWDDL